MVRNKLPRKITAASVVMFPPKLIDAVKLSLMNEPIFHGKLTVDDVCAKLKNEGEFLVQDIDNPDALVLSVFKDGVRDFQINIEHTTEGARFRLGGMCFSSLSDMTFQLKSVRYCSENIRLGTAIYRQGMCGRFGATCFVEETPRVTMKTMVPLPNLKLKSVLVPLKREIMHEGIEEELEALIPLKHRHLVPLLDYAFYSTRDPLILRYQTHDDVSLYDAVRKESYIKPATILIWLRQAASLAYYLTRKGCLHSILCAQDCYLDAGNNLKFRGAWRGSWPSWQDDTLQHPFYWRFLAPEALLHQTFTGSGVIWNLGVFMWQLSTECRLSPFFYLRNRQSFLQATISGDLVLVDSTRNTSTEDLGVVPKEVRLPPTVMSMISSCTVLAPEERCLWSDILNTCKRESIIASIGGVAKQVFPFL